MLITDHLDWEDETAHLLILQDKLNAYATFLETKQYEQVYQGKHFDSYLIEVDFLYEPTENCKKFMEIGEKQLAGLNVRIEGEYTP